MVVGDDATDNTEDGQAALLVLVVAVLWEAAFFGMEKGGRDEDQGERRRPQGALEGAVAQHLDGIGVVYDGVGGLCPPPCQGQVRGQGLRDKGECKCEGRAMAHVYPLALALTAMDRTDRMNRLAIKCAL